MPKRVKVVSKGKVKRTIFSIAIAIIYVMFIAYAIQSIYSSPKFEDYCSASIANGNYNTQALCEANNGKWNDYGATKPVETNVTGYCDVFYYCQQDYTKVNEVYNRNVFFVSLGLGIITIVVSILVAFETVSAGFMGGAVLLIIYGTIRYWGSLSDVWRTIMLGLALVILVWIGYKKLK